MSKPTIFIIGGTGAQGIPVIRGLVQDNAYAVRVLTRDPTSARAQQLAALSPNVHLLRGTFTSDSDLRAGLTGAWGAYINIDGFACGEALETFFTIRCYELAVERGVRFYVHGNIDFYYKLSGYNPAYRCGHGDAKGRMWEWISAQGAADRRARGDAHMRVAALTTGPYMDMALSAATPMSPTIEDTGEEVLTWRLPLTGDGAVAHSSLDDCAYYARWLFDHHAEVDGMNLEAGIDHVHYRDVARAFEKVTGRRARYVDVDFETYFSPGGGMGEMAGEPTGYMVKRGGLGVMTVRENFTGWWNSWRASGGNRGLVKRDYALLDEIYPGRTRDVEEFFGKEAEKAEREGRGTLWDVVTSGRAVLKSGEDGRHGGVGGN
ncbi:hypothetical protein B0T16DRAFT_329806 [Cercophora newfieldiana]|uniref:NmrA-like domain-containing protein n=1 Tax=Cercophora newfieldiana TaxID=92897 RepID=A0AA39Y6K7_9PEZI|nr:hypothetical protein B0T16DRAFT_329806 [Cercophora newfieldiana]